MKNAIKEYIELTDEEKKELWDKATFVFDTNILLSLYRYSKKTRDTLLSAMEELKERIWIPHQVAEEFMRNRVKVIFDTKKNYAELKDKILSLCNETLYTNPKDKEYKNFEKYIDKWINNRKTENLVVTSLDDDCILNQILELFDTRTGKPFDDNTLKELYDDGKKRYKNNIPPGYKDSNKQNGNGYGDLIVWKQILEYSKVENKDIILITNDKKEDWWNIVSGRTIGPRPELRKEFYNNGTNSFHMYNMEQFINVYDKIMNKEVDDSVIDEVSKEDNKNYINMNDIYPYRGLEPSSFVGNSSVLDALNVASHNWDNIASSINKPNFANLSVDKINNSYTEALKNLSLANLSVDRINNSYTEALKNLSLANYSDILKNYNDSYKSLNFDWNQELINAIPNLKKNYYGSLENKEKDYEEYKHIEDNEDKKQ